MSCLIVLGTVGGCFQRAPVASFALLRDAGPAGDLGEIEEALGQGVVIGLLGGFRAILADFLWLSVNLGWERRDLARTHALIRLATTVDARPHYFWINGARILAYDMPQWRIEAAGGPAVVGAAARRTIDEEQAELALELLAAALRHHPGDPFLLLEVGNIRLRRLGDLAAAAEAYREAAGRPGVPYYAARIHAEFLKQLGRKPEALAWLIDLHPRLPADDPTAMADVVLERIRGLENELRVADEDRYRPSRQNEGGERPGR